MIKNFKKILILVIIIFIINTLFINAVESLYINSNGNVGIGNNSPAEKLDVNGNIKFNSVIYTPGRMHINGGELCYILNKSGVIISQAWGGNGNLTVDGNVGIGTGSPTQRLDVNGNIRVAAGCIISGTRPNFFLALQGDRNFVVYDNGAAIWNSGTQVSDIRVKKDIKPLGDVLSKVDKLDVISFKYKEGVYDDKTHIGLIAQEVEKYFPDFVYTDAKSGRKLVYYDKLTSVLIQAVKELKSENDRIKQKLGM